MKKILFLFAIVSLAACKEKVESPQVHPAKSITIKKHSENNTLNDFLEMDSYVILSNEVTLGKIKRTIIWNDRIYILDSQSKIFCFSISGDYLFKISSIGRGPGEYMEIHNFSIDNKNGIINVYCNSSRKLISYSSRNGKFESEQKMRMSPLSIASNDGYNYFYSPYRTVPDKDLQYTLLSSKANQKLSERLFAYNSLSAFRYRSGLDFPFYYNQDELYFKKRFEPIIYTLKKGKAIPKYEIIMPNMTPLSFWEARPSRKLISSHQGTWGINNVYECCHYLYYLYSGEDGGSFIFYDIDKNNTLFYSQEKTYISSTELPIFSFINGVYNDSFFCVIDATLVSKFTREHPETMPNSLKGVEVSDNPVIFFYKPKSNEV